MDVLKSYNEKEEINRLEKYVKWNKDIIETIHNYFQECVSYIKFLQDNYKDNLNKETLNQLNKSVKEMVEFMNGFYNNEYQEILNAEKEAKQLMLGSKKI